MLALFFPFGLCLFQLFLQSFLRITEGSCFFKTLALYHFVLFQLDVFNLLFQLNDSCRHIDVLDVLPGPYFIQHVDGFIWQQAIGHVPVAQLHTGFDGFLAISYIMIILVFTFDVVQDLDGLLHGGLLYDYLLKTAVKGPVLFDMHPVFIQRGGTDALQFAPCQGRFEDIGSIQGTACPTCSNDGMYLIDEKYHVPVLLQFIHDRLHPFLELTTVFCTRNQCGQVKAHHPFIE